MKQRERHKTARLGFTVMKSRQRKRVPHANFVIREDHEAREAPQICANQQNQLHWLSLERCGCSPEQAARCGRDLQVANFYDGIKTHAEQVNMLHEAITDRLDGLDGRSPKGLPWQINIDQIRRISLRHEIWREHAFRTPYSKLLSDREISAAFATMLYVADDLDDAYRRERPRNMLPFCDAPTPTGRAYQAAAIVLTAFYDLRQIRVQVHQISAAKIVAEVVEVMLAAAVDQVPEDGRTRPRRLLCRDLRAR